jgi:hypothetical protein
MPWNRSRMLRRDGRLPAPGPRRLLRTHRTATAAARVPGTSRSSLFRGAFATRAPHRRSTCGRAVRLSCSVRSFAGTRRSRSWSARNTFRCRTRRDRRARFPRHELGVLDLGRLTQNSELRTQHSALTHPKSPGNRGVESSFRNSSHLFSGFSAAPPFDSMYRRTRSLPRL